MLARDDLADYIADHYGSCVRGTDCYHGVDAAGRLNGCQRTVWLGRACPHWRPCGARNWEELHAVVTQTSPARR